MPVPEFDAVSVMLNRSEEPVELPHVNRVVFAAIESDRFPVGFVSADHAEDPPPPPVQPVVVNAPPTPFGQIGDVPAVIPLSMMFENVWVAVHVFA